MLLLKNTTLVPKIILTNMWEPAVWVCTISQRWKEFILQARATYQGQKGACQWQGVKSCNIWGGNWNIKHPCNLPVPTNSHKLYCSAFLNARNLLHVSVTYVAIFREVYMQNTNTITDNIISKILIKLEDQTLVRHWQFKILMDTIFIK